ncbi:MAG: hypothetical protein E6R04_06815 [Spirochaetes bacterium]|nr:MAG: hypothetical protein E6R04_06815 [Spirochaetota bacterium]
MSNIVLFDSDGTNDTSPFDDIRQVRTDGTEFWSARDLMTEMGYGAWRNFTVPIGRAMKAAENQKVDLNSNFARSRKVAGGSGPAQEDYHLSRFAAYLVAMNGDPNKSEVALAQAYFAVQTHRAETLDRALDNGADNDDALAQFSMMRSMLDNMERNHILAKQARLEAATAHQKAVAANTAALEARVEAAEARSEAAIANARIDGIEHNTGYYSALAYARLTNLPSSNSFLKDLGTRAGKVGRAMGIASGTAPDERFGTVNTWPVQVWNAAAAALRAEGKIQ